MKIARKGPAVLPAVVGLLLFSIFAWGVIELFRVDDAREVDPSRSDVTAINLKHG